MQDRAMKVLEETLQVRADVAADGERLYNSWLKYDIRKPYQNSAQNLAYYMAFRQKDMRHLQEELIPWGVSSLGRLEVDVMGTLNAVSKTLSLVAGSELKDESIDYRSMKTFENRYNLLNKHTDEIFGAGSDDRNTHILVTMPAEAAADKEMVGDMMEAGMDMARINCAHDDERVWKKMIGNIRKRQKRADGTARF